MNHQTIKLGNTEYVILPKAEYLNLQALAGIPVGSVDAVEFARASIGRDLRAAREHAGLTQTELAARLGKSQPMVSGAEGGTISVSERYVAAVLKACGLPANWSARKAKAKRGEGRIPTMLRTADGVGTMKANRKKSARRGGASGKGE